jgi:hypothetical protein
VLPLGLLFMWLKLRKPDSASATALPEAGLASAPSPRPY